ncbi:MAG: OmpA family protein, partial [Leptonema sp. (in: Bacteria)]|nr:OmpA family protein [Leptonema sp. (in: bacteria)]
ERNSSGGESARIEGLYQSGSITDKGMLHRLEVEWNYCRWHIASGFERDNWKRTHSMFMTASNQSRDVASHGSLLGLGEMSSSKEGYRNELYLRVGVSAYFGDTKVVKSEVTSKLKDESTKPEDQPTPQITKDSSDYLNQMYSKIKDDYDQKQEVLDQTENSFRALGIEVKKEVNSEGLTVNLQASIDGDIAFKTGSAELTAKAFEVVDKFGDALNQNPITVARVHGHTDTPGSKQGNRILSQRRAESVQRALISRKGISASRIIEVKGFADDRKIVQTNAQEPKNRRTVILIEYGE